MNSVTLEVLIAMAGAYFVLAFVLTAVIEALAAFFGWRSELLRETIENFVGDRRLSRLFYSDPVIRSLFSPRSLGRSPQPPSSIRPKTFAETLVRLLFRPPSNGSKTKELTAKYVVDRLDELRKSSPEERLPLISRLRYCSERARTRSKRIGEEFGEAFLAEVGTLFSEVVDRLKGRYRRRVMVWSICIGLVGSACINFDSIGLVSTLYENSQAREAVVADSVVLVQGGDSIGVSEAKEQLGSLPPGWGGEDDFSGVGLPIKVIGFLISGLALSLGAPFWFDLLGKLVSLRSGGRDSEEEQKRKDSPSVAADGSGPPASGSKPTVILEAAESTAELARSCLGRLGENSAARFSFSDAFALAEVSRLSYETPEKMREAFGSDWTVPDPIGAGESAALTTQHGRFRGDTQVFLLKNEKTKTAILAFRGTEPNKLADLWTDLQLDREAEPCLGEVHRGFRRALDASVGDGERDSLQKNLTDLLDSLLFADGAEDKEMETSEYSLWMTGHSLGGALAHLYAARYLRDRPDARARFRGCLTYGEPRVGNRAFARESHLLAGGRIIRFVNDLDIVTRIPPRLVGFDHSRPCYLIDRAGSIVKSEEEPCFILRWFSFAWSSLAKWRSGSWKGFREPLEDHGIENYTALLGAEIGGTVKNDTL